MKELADLKPGMALEGVVTNVTKFGAFVDVGVHQDGLVHISELSNRYIKEPSEAVKVGQIVKVQVLNADVKNKRIALSIKALLAPAQKAALSRRRRLRRRSRFSWTIRSRPSRINGSAGEFFWITYIIKSELNCHH